MNTARAPATLPKTIEEATRRYIYNYEKNYSGPASDLFRLSHMTKAFIYRLRKVAPKFYEEKLPAFVNQACSSLLVIDTNTEDGAMKFHQTHGMFLKILDEFKRSQPTGEVDFQSERVRVEEKARLQQKQINLQRRMEKLEALELPCDDMGEEEENNEYTRILREIDEVQLEQRRVNYEIALIEGLQTEPETHFELKIGPRSILNRLTVEQRDHLERQMLELVKESKKRTAMYVDISVIDGMIAKLNINPDLFKKEELRQISKDALDAYKEYFRKIEMSRREAQFDELLHSSHLFPKEGDIIEDPDAVPEEVKMKLERHSKILHGRLDQILLDYGSKPCAEDQAGELIDDSGDEEDDKARIMETIRQKGIRFGRVKEEPRDDCDLEDLDSEEELYVDNEVADRDGSIENGHDNKANAMEVEASSDDDYEDDDGDEDEIECLGTIEPNDKIRTFEVDD